MDKSFTNDQGEVNRDRQTSSNQQQRLHRVDQQTKHQSTKTQSINELTH